MKRLLALILVLLPMTARAAWGVWPNSTALTAHATLKAERLMLSPWIVKVSLKNTSKKTVSGSISPCPLVYVIQKAGKTLATYPMKKKFQRSEMCTLELIEFTLKPGEKREVYVQQSYSKGDPPTRVPKGTYRIIGRLFVMAGTGKPTPQTVPFDNTVVMP